MCPRSAPGLRSPPLQPATDHWLPCYRPARAAGFAASRSSSFSQRSRKPSSRTCTRWRLAAAAALPAPLAESQPPFIIALRSTLHRALRARGQVAQLVERSPEKAGVGGSIPSLATITLSDLNNFAAFRWPMNPWSRRAQRITRAFEIAVCATDALLSNRTSSRAPSPTAGSMVTRDQGLSAKWSRDVGRQSGGPDSTTFPARLS